MQKAITMKGLDKHKILSVNQHAHSRSAVRNSRTETVMHALIIWYLRAKT